MTVIKVDAAQMRAAAKGLAGNANAASDSYSKVSAAMGSIGGMAGSDPAAQDWGHGFDSALARALQAHYSSVGAVANCAELTDATAVNHLNADGQSVVGPKPTPEALGISKTNLVPMCIAPPPSSAGGDDASKPWWWAKIQHLVGDIWPNGHQDRLHSAAASLRTAATELRSVASQMQGNVAVIENQISPEIDSATVTLIKLQTGLNSVAGTYDQLAQNCDDHAHHIDDAHSQMEEAAAELIGLALLDVLTDGALSAAVARVAARVMEIYEDFRGLLQTARLAIKGTEEAAEATEGVMGGVEQAVSKVESFSEADSAAMNPAKDLTKPTGDPATAHLPPLRQHYIQDVQQKVGSLVQELRQAGASDEQIARAANAERRAIGQEYKDATPEPMKSQIYGRNEEKYGDPLGPTYDYLKAQGKTDQQIIDASQRTGGGDLGLGQK